LETKRKRFDQMSLSAEEAAKQWIAWDKNPKTRQIIQDLIEKKAWDDLSARMFPRISFGTAGLRAKMDSGYAFMNDLVIVQTAQGLCEHLIACGLQHKGIVVGHDHRHNSERFARLTAGVFLSKGIKAYFFKRNVHTPSVPWTIKKLAAGCGVMVTASHNPKDDNGFKVYWENAAQINSPVDKDIATSIMNNLEPKVWDENLVETSDLW
jgi:phosphomannomutase